MKIAIIGCGNMGMTYALSFVKSHILNKEDLYLLDKHRPTIEKSDYPNKTSEVGSWLSDMDLIVLAIKPQDTSKLFTDIKKYISNDKVVLSIMAGVKMETICEGLDITKVVRAMPNLPAQIREGMTVFTATDEVSKSELLTVQNLLNTTGLSIYREDENMIDAATAISGSGPAYVFYFMNAMMEKAKEFGFSHSEAELLSYQTFHGAVELFNNKSLTCQEWIDKVSSKGGTTEAAITEMTSQAVDTNIQLGIQKALDRAVELSKK